MSKTHSRHPIRLEVPAATVPVPRPVAGVGSVQHRYLDAKRWGCMADDFARFQSPTLVALVQAATSLPVFLVGLPSGAIADLIDRRRLLLATQAWMLLAASALGLLTMVGAMTPWALLALTFALGLGAAMNAPAWQAIIPELVGDAELRAAVTLNGIGYNVARAVGPALGGMVVATFGSGAVFLLNAGSFLGVMIGSIAGHKRPHQSKMPLEDVFGAMRAGARYVRHSSVVQAVLIRTAAFIFGGSAIWALLPLVARDQLALDATGYGIILGCLGARRGHRRIFLPRIDKVVDRTASVGRLDLALRCGDRRTRVCDSLRASLRGHGRRRQWRGSRSCRLSTSRLK